MRASFLAVLGAIAIACGTDPASSPAAGDQAASGPAESALVLPTVDVDLLRGHIRELSSDAYEGRAPGTPGGAKTVAYIEAQMQALGLAPTGDTDTFRQTVPMRGVSPDPARTEATLRTRSQRTLALRPLDDIVLFSDQEAGTTQFDAELVFVGYGIVASEYEWDDFSEHDMSGKIAVVLVGDPPLRDGRFAGDAMTYYGRWTYKFERALAAGARGCIVIHDQEAASYGWNVVINSWSGERLGPLEADGSIPAALDVQGWIHNDAAERLAELAGTTLAQWQAAALAPGFRPIATGVALHGQVVTTERRLHDVNVVGRIPATTPTSQGVIVTAHWDHLGRRSDAGADDDAIFNGAIDNASGIAGMLATAAAVQTHRTQGGELSRNVIFVATTGEEQGLLGSRWFATHPSGVALADIAGVINFDSMNVFGPTDTITVIGAGQSSLEDTLDEVARTQGRTLVPDDRPEAGSYYRSDQFSFAVRGVPALYFRGGPVMRDGGRQAGQALVQRYATRYHTVDDEYDESWPLTGALQDVEALAQLLIRVANAEAVPTWKPSSEFAGVMGRAAGSTMVQ